jgi:hypothetical protein
MDPRHFDDITKALVTETSRRQTFRALLGGAAGILAVVDAEAGSGRCAPACGPCATCKKGTCKKKRGKKRCKPGKCILKPDDTTCDSTGKCLNGTCNPPPGCSSLGQLCTPPDQGDCCGPVCTAFGPGTGLCSLPAPIGSSCNVNIDCVSQKCVGFRCVP